MPLSPAAAVKGRSWIPARELRAARWQQRAKELGSLLDPFGEGVGLPLSSHPFLTRLEIQEIKSSHEGVVFLMLERKRPAFPSGLIQGTLEEKDEAQILYGKMERLPGEQLLQQTHFLFPILLLQKLTIPHLSHAKHITC